MKEFAQWQTWVIAAIVSIIAVIAALSLTTVYAVDAKGDIAYDTTSGKPVATGKLKFFAPAKKK